MSTRHRSPSSSDEAYESGYVSGSSTTSSLPDVYFTRPHLKFINAQLAKLEPQDVLRWCLTSLPQLWQTSAFGLTGLAIMDMISKLDYAITPNVEMIFLDTLHHFDQTLELVDRVRARYPDLRIHTFKPKGCDTAADFERTYGPRFWETDEDRYDYVAKVEPAQRAYQQLDVKAVLTGRRRSQGGKRGDLDILEIDDQGLIKVNPLANWSFKQVQSYIQANAVPTNALLDQGYRSVGDWHSTVPVAEGEDERAGRWKGRTKTECGIHNKKSRYAQFLQDQEEKRQQELSDAITNGLKIDALQS
nr:phosphoadenosine phosphosulfate reductase [Quercus suber]